MTVCLQSRTKDEYGVLVNLICKSNKSASLVASYEKNSQEDCLEEDHVFMDNLKNHKILLKKEKIQ